MVRWPFAGGKKEGPAQEQRGTAEAMAQSEKARMATSAASRPNTGHKRDLGAKPIPRSRTPSLPQPSRSQTAPVQSGATQSSSVRPLSRQRQKELYQQVAPSQSSLGPDNVTVLSGPPTLYAKRSETDTATPRRKSSKRKADDYAREKEIRAMASSPIPIPKRPATRRSESPLARERRQISAGLSRRLERQSSEVSLPLAESFSNLDFATSQNSFKIGMLAALRPRPNIRYDAQAPQVTGSSMRPGMMIQKAIEEEDVSDQKRIDELADDLDAGGLRELMERDQKRRAKKREADKARLQQKLERRAARQHEEDTRRARTEAFVRESSPANVTRRTNQRTESPAARSLKAETKTVIQKTQRAPRSRERANPFADDVIPSSSTAPVPKTAAPIRNPFEDEHDGDSAHYGSDDEPVDRNAALPMPLKSVGVTRGAPKEAPRSPPLSPVNHPDTRSSFSQGAEPAPEGAEDAERNQQSPGERNNVRLSTWTTFFSRGTRRRLATPTPRWQPPSEFSTTSRESLQRKQLPPVVTEMPMRRSSSGTPQRATSRFREDLPELPISPPDSRVQSPTSAPTPIRIIDATSGRYRGDDRVDSEYLRGSVEINLPGSTTGPAQLSRSMASVDSEGSWLSGRPSKRVSGASGLANSTRRSVSSLQKSTTRGTEQEDPEVPAPSEPFPVRESSLQPLQPSETGGGLGHSGKGDHPVPQEDLSSSTSPAPRGESEVHTDARKQPAVVNPPGRIQSAQASLNELISTSPTKADPPGPDDQPHDEDESPGSVEIIDAPLLRAKSVEYKGHARAVSAGSAKLLEIRRTSTHSDLSRPRSPTMARKSGLGLNQQDDSTPPTPTTTTTER